MDTTRICKACRQPLPENAPEGLCPACLAKVALGTEPAAPDATINIDPLAAQAAPGTRVPPAPADLAAQFPQLEIIELLGMGGMGMVYKARQPRLDRLVALKILPVEAAQHPSFAERFSREAKALAKLNHPGIVDVYDFGQTAQYYFFVMEYVDGMNLRRLLQTQTLEPRQALDIVVQICTALQYAHDEGVVHRDIKPENILLNKKGQVKIADFGLAKLMGAAPDTALTMSQAAMGTLNYMAPEQRENAQKVDHRADIYSLGVVFYEMLTGEVPMGRFAPPSQKVQVDVRLDEVVLRALEREPARRYQQVSEVKTGVETITSTLPREKETPPAPEAFKLQPPPGFVSYVAKRFALFAVAWLVTGFFVRLALGDKSLAVDPHGSIASIFISINLILFCQLFADLGMAKFVLPAVFVTLVGMWLEARARGGLTSRQLPPAIRRRLGLWLAVITCGYIAAVLAPVLSWPYVGEPISMREFQSRQDEATEWWFVPNSGAYEKLGLRAVFASVDQRGKTDSGSLPPCTVSLILHQTNAEPAVMEVVLPGLRAKYRFPATNSWDYAFILDKDSLVEWLHKAAGLEPAAPKSREEAGQIYALLKAYELQPPQTVKELVNLAKADLRDSWFGGAQSGGFSFGGGSPMGPLLALVGAESLVYAIFAMWANKRLYRAAWIEISAGRWTPPKKRPNRLASWSHELRVGVAALVLLGLMSWGAAFCFRSDSYVSAGVVLAAALGIFLSFGQSLYARWAVRRAREQGLWPALGEVPTVEHVKRLAQKGQKRLAIKLYRQICPVSLKSAKELVEGLAG